MTTTAHEDQFTAATERHIAQPYDVTAILRQNVADLEKQLQQQQERAEKAESALSSAREYLQSFIDSRDAWMARANAAEAELAKAREQEPLTFVHDPNGYAIGGTHTEIADALPIGTDLYARPIPAPAPYLLEGRRFKISINGEGGFYGFDGFPELNGQWVALVDATDNQHMQSAEVKT